MYQFTKRFQLPPRPSAPHYINTKYASVWLRH